LGIDTHETAALNPLLILLPSDVNRRVSVPSALVALYENGVVFDPPIFSISGDDVFAPS
jgi:hypothetical protein